MIIQVHTSAGVIDLDTSVNTSEEFSQYGLDKDALLIDEVSGTFTTVDGKVITVVDGKITNIEEI
jgi:hypothetical protein